MANMMKMMKQAAEMQKNMQKKGWRAVGYDLSYDSMLQDIKGIEGFLVAAQLLRRLSPNGGAHFATVCTCTPDSFRSSAASQIRLDVSAKALRTMGHFTELGVSFQRIRVLGFTTFLGSIRNNILQQFAVPFLGEDVPRASLAPRFYVDGHVRRCYS